jgi:uncharacterized protein YdcH (DUF465 family)
LPRESTEWENNKFMKKSELKSLISEVIAETLGEDSWKSRAHDDHDPLDDEISHLEARTEAIHDRDIEALRKRYGQVIGEEEFLDIVAVVWSAAKGKKVQSRFL